MKQCIVCLVIAFLLAISVSFPAHAQTVTDSARQAVGTNRNYDAPDNHSVSYNYLGLLGLLGLYGLHRRRTNDQTVADRRTP